MPNFAQKISEEVKPSQLRLNATATEERSCNTVALHDDEQFRVCLHATAARLVLRMGQTCFGGNGVGFTACTMDKPTTDAATSGFPEGVGATLPALAA